MKHFFLTIFIVFACFVNAQVPPDTEPANNFFATAPEAMFSSATTSYSLSNGDKDIFWVTVPDPGGVIEVNATNIIGIQPVLRFYSVPTTGDTVCRYFVDFTDSVGQVVVPGGKYYIRVSDQNDNEFGVFDISITLNTGDEREFNNFFLSATDLNPDGSVISNMLFQANIYGRYKISGTCSTATEAWDRDLYKIYIPPAGAVLEAKVTNYTGIQPRVRIYSADTLCTHLLTVLDSISVVLPAGIHYLRINDDGDNETSQELFDVFVNIDTSDRMEFNNFFSMATDLNPSGEDPDTTFTATIWGRYSHTGNCVTFYGSNDRDYYKVNVLEPGGVIEVRMADVPVNIQPEIQIYRSDTTCDFIANSQSVRCDAVVPAGVYYIKINEVDNNAVSKSPYQVTVSINYDDTLEFNNHFSTATPLPLNDSLPGQIYGEYGNTGTCEDYVVTNDRDYYKFTIDRCGKFKAIVKDMHGNIGIQLKLYASDTTLAPIANINGTSPINQLVRVLNPGTYYLLLNDQDNNATTDTLYKIVTVFDPLPRVPTIFVIGDTAFCEGGNVALASSFFSGNLWMPGLETTQNLTVEQSGTYFLQVDSAGCTNYSDSIIVNVTQNPVADFTFMQGENNSITFTNTSEGAETFEWNFGDDSAISTEENPTHTYVNGDYTVTLITTNSCSTDTVSYVVSLSTGINEFNDVNGIQISPNPCSVCELRGKFNPDDLVFTDLLGKKHEAIFVATAAGYRFEMKAGAPRGVYFITNKRTLQVIKFVAE